MAYVDILEGDSGADILVKLNTGLGAADTAVQPDDAVDTLAETATAKILTGDERTKLTGIADGATANSADATLLDRANHTGTQDAATVTGLASIATSGEIVSDTTPQLGGPLDAQGNAINNYSEAVNAFTTSGTTTLNLALGMVQRCTLGGNHELTMPADPGAVSRSFLLQIDCAGFTPTWAASPAIVWLTSDGDAPALNTIGGKVNELGFRWDDWYNGGAGAWIGRLGGSQA